MPDGYGFGQFSKTHLLMIGVTSIFIVVISLLYSYFTLEIRSIIRITIAITLIVLELMKLAVLYFTHGKVSEYIPLEICSFGAYSIMADALFSPNIYIPELLLVAFLPAAVIALLYPTTISLPVYNFYTLHQFIFHCLIVAYAISRFAAGEIVFDYAGVWVSILSIFCIALFVYIIDVTCNRNYMFLIHDEGSSLLTTIRNIFGSGRKYTLALVGISVVVIHIFYFIFKLIEILCN